KPDLQTRAVALHLLEDPVAGCPHASNRVVRVGHRVTRSKALQFFENGLNARFRYLVDHLADFGVHAALIRRSESGREDKGKAASGEAGKSGHRFFPSFPSYHFQAADKIASPRHPPNPVARTTR